MKIFALVFLCVGLQVNTAAAATCCGSNFSAPALMTTGEKYKIQLTQNISRKDFYAKEEEQVVLLKEKKFSTKTNLKGAASINDGLQLLVESSFAGNQGQSQLLGDSLVGMGFAFQQTALSQSWIHASIIFPTGKPTSALEDASTIPTGAGYHQAALGGLYSQIFSWGDAAIGGQISRNIHSTQSPEAALSAFAGLGRSFDQYRSGISWSAIYSSTGTSSQAQAYSQSVSLQLSYMGQSYLVGASYSDDSLLGPAKNSYLNKSLSVDYIIRWF